MSATATLATSVHSLCLFPQHPLPTPKQQQKTRQTDSSSAEDTTDSKDKQHGLSVQQRYGAGEAHPNQTCSSTQQTLQTTAFASPALSPPEASPKMHPPYVGCSDADPNTATTSSKSRSSSRQSNYVDDSSWPRAVDALAQRLWDCGHGSLSRGFPSSSSSSSSSSSTTSSNFLSTTQMESAMAASFRLNARDLSTHPPMSGGSNADAAVSDKECDEDSVLCDGPYVHVNYTVAPSEPLSSPSNRSVAPTLQRQHQNQHQTRKHPLTLRREPQTPSFPTPHNDLLYPPPMSAPETKSLHPNAHVFSDRLQLIHYQPMTNPFKTMAKSATASPTTAYLQKPMASLSSSSSATTADSPSTTANSATNATARAEKKPSHYFSNRRQRGLLPGLVSPTSLHRSTKRHHYEKDDALPLPLPQTARPMIAPALGEVLAKSAGCVHCKQGNFLEFCFVVDKCICKCHNDCPCNPCTNIRSHRSCLSSTPPYAKNHFFANHAQAVKSAKATTAVGDAYARRSVISAATSASPASAAADKGGGGGGGGGGSSGGGFWLG
ncbi:hypothetical protein H4217_007945 [Coemansia sp. RSA 1939]|nr:hypothetical protein H4217_007945 [Coemansia sp. RSA 1939]KAJ2604842.1 hypothetical protein EV177_006294 [Coemansia sp. RSA 1804]